MKNLTVSHMFSTKRGQNMKRGEKHLIPLSNIWRWMIDALGLWLLVVFQGLWGHCEFCWVPGYFRAKPGYFYQGFQVWPYRELITKLSFRYSSNQHKNTKSLLNQSLDLNITEIQCFYLKREIHMHNIRIKAKKCSKCLTWMSGPTSIYMWFQP